VQMRIVLLAARLAAVALMVAPVRAADQGPGMRPPRETEAQRIARETIAAARASEQGTLTTSLAPLPPSQRRAVAGAPGRPMDQLPVARRVQPDPRLGPARRHGAAHGGLGQRPGAAGRRQSPELHLLSRHLRDVPAAHARGPVLQRPCHAAQRQHPDRRRHQRYDPFYGLRTSYEYNWVTRQFVRLPLMAGGGRWYPGATQLAAATSSSSPASTAPARSTPSRRSTATAPGA
jgi:hypothetical protein